MTPLQNINKGERGEGEVVRGGRGEESGGEG